MDYVTSCMEVGCSWWLGHELPALTNLRAWMQAVADHQFGLQPDLVFILLCASNCSGDG